MRPTPPALALALALALAAAPASAALPPCAVDVLVREAVTVIQVVDTTVTRSPGTTACQLEGTVARSFRGTLEPGTRIVTTFACPDPDAPAGAPVEVGPTIWWDAESVAAAGAVEIHGAAEGGPAGHGAGMVLLDAPTDAVAYEYLPECAE